MTTKRVVYTSRSRLLEYQRCPRSRYWLHEAYGHGFELVRQSIPLATGHAGHLVLAGLLQGSSPEDAIGAALEDYDRTCAERGLRVKELEDQSLVYKEQRALVEGIGWLAALRVVPALFATYEVLEVEKLDEETLCESDEVKVIWRSIPDGLLRHRETGELYVLSWKIPAEAPRDVDARTDMQGLSEVWALGARLARLGMDAPIRGVQMAYLFKGRKIPAKDEGEGAMGKAWRHNSPLIWGYRDQGFPPKLTASREWRCSAPHAMRKSKWYPNGECPGDGRNHLRGGDWQSFLASESMGVKEWIELLASGDLSPEEGDPLSACWSLPVPNFRQNQEIERWYRQAVEQERRIAGILPGLPSQQAEADYNWQAFLEFLDTAFSQHTERWCNDTYGSKCPAWEICHGPDQVARYPLASGLYRIRQPYRSLDAKEADGGENEG